MIWKPIPGYELYDVSDTGVIRNAKTLRVLKQSIRNNGYFSVLFTPYRKNLLVHRAVIKAFKDNPENKPYCNHKDGNKLNNDISNLEWCTGKENRIHAVSTGLITNTTKGIRMHSKLDSLQVKAIRLCLANWHISKTPCRDLANHFNVSPTLISAIKRRVAWANE